VSASLSARLTRKSGSSFYYAFRVLPAAKRRAIYALYSFCRVVDDCVDEPGGEGEAGLARWLEEVHCCYAGRPTTPLGRELAEMLFQFPVPRGCFEDIVAGCRMDLELSRYPRFSDLRLYCERVASAVGLAAIEIFEYRRPETRAYAVELGVALQLTNILRDVGTDAARGRLYLPLEDLQRFGISEGELLAAAAREEPATGVVREALAFQARRARSQHAQAEALLPAEDARAMLPARIMGAVYRRLLARIEERGFPMAAPVTLSRPLKAWIAVRTLLAAYAGPAPGPGPATP
jgi:15-cis-phytoene synthase